MFVLILSLPECLALITVLVQLEHILGRYGCLIVERAGTGMDQATDSLARWRSNIHLISQLIQNDVSSTKVCEFFC